MTKDETNRFISSSFRSVWSLEVLLLLKRDVRDWTSEELVEALRASDGVIAQALGSLEAAGLVSAVAGKVRYLPVTEQVSRLVDETERLYALRPDAVRRMIVNAANSGLAAFADAFRLRRD